MSTTTFTETWEERLSRYATEIKGKKNCLEAMIKLSLWEFRREEIDAPFTDLWRAQEGSPTPALIAFDLAPAPYGDGAHWENGKIVAVRWRVDANAEWTEV